MKITIILIATLIASTPLHAGSIWSDEETALAGLGHRQTEAEAEAWALEMRVEELERAARARELEDMTGFCTTPACMQRQWRNEEN